MSEYQKQLTQHQAALAELNKQLPQLRATAREAEQTFSKSRAGKPRFPHELVAPYTNAKAAIDQHNAEINRLRGLVSWEEGVRSASSDIRKAQKEAMCTQGELTKLVEKRTKISSKLEKAQREQRGEIEKAQTAEQRAADAYAAALADGDDAAEERAEKALKQASEAMTQAAQGKRGLNTLMATLTTEIEKLDVAISDAKQRLADYRQDQLNAARLLWAERLDKAAQDFAKVAAQFTATEKALGRRYSNLEDLNVPLQAPMGPKHITHRKILEMAQAISIEELLVA